MMDQAHLKRKLAAIFSADAAGYSRLMEADEETTVRTLTRYRDIMSKLIQEHGGRVVDSPGDNLLAQFASVVNAVQCAVAVQKEIAVCNRTLNQGRRMAFRIGINVGDVIQEGGRIYGDGVNIAARLEGLAEPGGICISKAVFDHIQGKVPFACAYLGDRSVKNMAKPVSAYRVLAGAEATASKWPPAEKGGGRRHKAIVSGVVAVAVAIAISATLWLWADRRPEPAPSALETKAMSVQGKPFIAVLPFENMSDDPDQEYFSDGMAEEVISRLSRNPGIVVIARSSTFFYKGGGTPIQQIGRELNARYVVEGSVRRAGNRVRVTAQLIDATTEGHIWAGTYDSEFEDIFNLQDEIAQKVVAALNIKSREAEQARAWRVPTENLTAYDALLRGVSRFTRISAGENAKARLHFEEALSLDPEYATAYVMLGYTLLMEVVFGTNRDPAALEQASELASRALSLDSASYLAHVLLAEVFRTRGRYEQAVVHAEKALSLNPNDPSAYRALGIGLNSLGRFEAAVEAVQKAMLLDPLQAVYYSTDLAGAYRNLGAYDQAIAVLEDALLRNPDWVLAYFELTMNCLMAWSVAQSRDPGLLGRAAENAERLMAYNAFSPYGHFAMPLVYLYKKQHDKALAGAEKLLALAPENADSHALAAAVYISVGKGGEAIRMLETAMQLRPETPAWYLGTLATAYTLAGRQAEAEEMYKRVFAARPSHADAVNARIELILLYAGSGRQEAARAQAQELLKLVPGFLVETWGQRTPNTHKEQVEQSMEGLRSAGLP